MVTRDGRGVARGARRLALAATMALLFALTALVVSVGATTGGGGRLTVLVGFLLLTASLSGRLAFEFGLPRLTGYLLLGIAAGPSMLGMIDPGAVADLQLIDDFALALIAMLAGGELRVRDLRAQARTIVSVTVMVTLIVTLTVAGTVVAVRPWLPFLTALPFEATIGVALLLGLWAANSSPDLTVAVVEEVRATGPLKDVIVGVTIVKDVLVIVLFTLALGLLGPLVDASRSFTPDVLLGLGREVLGALVIGSGLGWVFSVYLSGSDRPRPPLATFLFAYVVVLVAHRLHVELLLTGVAAGFVIENLSAAGDRMIRGIESVSMVIFALFFAIAGARLDLGAVARFWEAAVVLFSARLLFTWAGAHVGSRMAGADLRIRADAWRGLVSQGGVTLGLVLLIERSFPVVGRGVVSLGMAVIIGNILGGPILLKSALNDAGVDGA